MIRVIQFRGICIVPSRFSRVNHFALGLLPCSESSGASCPRWYQSKTLFRVALSSTSTLLLAFILVVACFASSCLRVVCSESSPWLRPSLPIRSQSLVCLRDAFFSPSLLPSSESSSPVTCFVLYSLLCYLFCLKTLTLSQFACFKADVPICHPCPNSLLHLLRVARLLLATCLVLVRLRRGTCLYSSHILCSESPAASHMLSCQSLAVFRFPCSELYALFRINCLVLSCLL